MKNHLAPKGSHCELCRYNNNKLCGECVFGTGNSKLKDNFYPSGTVLVMRGQNIKRADYYDKVVSALINWNGKIEDDIINYRQW